ncbi:MAG: carbohydrate ABC transporter permease [Chloroflexota bacterium]
MSRRTRRNLVTGLLFMAPFLLGLVVFTFYPLADTAYLGFTHFNGTDPPRWIGLNNYRFMLNSDDLYQQALFNMGYMVLISVPLTLVTAFVHAWLLSFPVRGRALYRAALVLPAFMPLVAVTLIWTWLFNPELGVVDIGLAKIGLPQPNWLTDATWSKPCLILLMLWTVGTTTIVYLAALQQVPAHLYEAAQVDGANLWRRLWHITIPMVSPATFFNLIIGMINTFQIFTQGLILTSTSYGSSVGAPEGSLMFPVMYMWNSLFAFARFGYASAQATLLFLMILVVTLILIVGARRWVHYEAT